MHLYPGDIETAYAAYLEDIQDGRGVADGCDEAMLKSRRWATPDNNDWRLTDEGRRHLQQWGRSTRHQETRGGLLLVGQNPDTGLGTQPSGPGVGRDICCDH